jgi:hypothetical protein
MQVAMNSLPTAVVSVAAGMAVITLVIAVLLSPRARRLRIGPLDLILDQERRIRDRLPAPGTEPRQEDRQYALLREYHAQSLAQSKVSFWFSLVFASLGFVVIVSGLLLVDRNSDLASQGATIFSLISGTIVEAVSGLFFVQSNKSRELMGDFFNRLRVDRKLDEALRLVSGMGDGHLRSKTEALLALHFSEVNPGASILEALLAAALTSEAPQDAMPEHGRMSTAPSNEDGHSGEVASHPVA